MRLILTMLVLGCAEDKVPCGEGFGRVPSGDCAPVDLGEAADTGFEGASDNTPPMAPGIELRPGAPRAGGFYIEGGSLDPRGWPLPPAESCGGYWTSSWDMSRLPPPSRCVGQETARLEPKLLNSFLVLLPEYAPQTSAH